MKIHISQTFPSLQVLGRVLGITMSETLGLKFGHCPKAWMWAESGLPNGPYPEARLELDFVSR